MRDRTIATIVAGTYVALLGVWLATLRPARQMSSRQPVLMVPEVAPARSQSKGRLLITSGVLLVFLANILTLGLFLGSLFSSRLAACLPRLRIRLPRAVNVMGACGFILGGIWGTLVLIYNPGYTPFFVRRSRAARLATRGPYAVVRHPRYAVEAALNIVIAAFTGTWFPLLGILGWPAMRRQARIEEEDLVRAVPVAYSEYAGRTGAFLPRPGALRWR